MKEGKSGLRNAVRPPSEYGGRVRHQLLSRDAALSPHTYLPPLPSLGSCNKESVHSLESQTLLMPLVVGGALLWGSSLCSLDLGSLVTSMPDLSMPDLITSGNSSVTLSQSPSVTDLIEFTESSIPTKGDCSNHSINLAGTIALAAILTAKAVGRPIPALS